MYRTEEAKARHREEQRRYRLCHPEKVRESQRRCRRKTRSSVKSSAKYRQQHPERSRARHAVFNAIKAGRLVRPGKCDECGKICKPEGHHDDHFKPLEVQWLCRACHLLKEGKVERVLNPAPNIKLDSRNLTLRALSKEEVLYIREPQNKLSIRRLGAQLGVSYKVIWYIRNGLTYKEFYETQAK